MNRRSFITGGALALAGVAQRPARGAGPTAGGSGVSPLRLENPITIARTGCGFEREPMVRPFGFKGGYLTEEWVVSSYIRSASGKHGIGRGGNLDGGFGQCSVGQDNVAVVALAERDGHAFDKRDLRALVRTFDYFQKKIH